jgi:integrase
MKARTFEGEKEIDLLIRILNYAVRKRALPYNPASAVKSELRGRKGVRSRAILPREVVHPETVERIRLHMDGTGIQRDRHRLLVSALAYLGLRPSEALALRWEDVLVEPGLLRRHVLVDSAVKDIAGRQEEGPTKTGESRDVLLWPVVGEEFLELYRPVGEPESGALVFANSRGGGYMDFGNWRHRHWYWALYKAGLAAAPQARAAGAFDPYCLPHSCATLMMHTLKLSGSLATHNRHEIAVQLGNTPQTLDQVYLKVMDDQHGVAGLTMDEAIRQARIVVAA